MLRPLRVLALLSAEILAALLLASAARAEDVDAVFPAGLAGAAKHPEAGRALIAYMSSPEAAPVMERMGLEPAKR